ncbi:uncharacterized protein LOC115634682 [Scaptodrosophila lebanonensis]|uniref:Uncharacterized protein LOC115634682 n=1 Tax=Drosophila lebanonensis TaxID=7225 RepID=A0A6J2UJ36_DROLE|nr:uncharacterized protein LOC115634682 [Scaptodrosophila lebanonensis]
MASGGYYIMLVLGLLLLLGTMPGHEAAPASEGEPDHLVRVYRIDQQQYEKVLNLTNAKNFISEARLISGGFSSVSNGFNSLTKDLSSGWNSLLRIVGFTPTSKQNEVKVDGQPLCVVKTREGVVADQIYADFEDDSVINCIVVLENKNTLENKVLGGTVTYDGSPAQYPVPSTSEDISNLVRLHDISSPLAAPPAPGKETQDTEEMVVAEPMVTFIVEDEPESTTLTPIVESKTTISTTENPNQAVRPKSKPKPKVRATNAPKSRKQTVRRRPSYKTSNINGHKFTSRQYENPYSQYGSENSYSYPEQNSYPYPYASFSPALTPDPYYGQQFGPAPFYGQPSYGPSNTSPYPYGYNSFYEQTEEPTIPGNGEEEIYGLVEEVPEDVDEDSSELDNYNRSNDPYSVHVQNGWGYDY